MNNDRFLDVVDFVEQHGGSLSGEARDDLKSLVSACQSDYQAEQMAKLNGALKAIGTGLHEIYDDNTAAFDFGTDALKALGEAR